MKRRGLIVLSVLVVAALGFTFYWFAYKHDIYNSNIDNVKSIRYTYSDYMGKTSTDSIVDIDEVNEIKNAIKEVDLSKPKRKFRAEQKTTGLIITFTMLDEDNNEITSYSINGEYLAVGKKDNKLVTIYSVADEEMDHLRDIFRNSFEN
ncbi:MAG: hypothetical protein WAV55_06890 [Clostridiaceae bacterium]